MKHPNSSVVADESADSVLSSPAGLAVAPDGSFSGSPDEAGIFTFLVEVCDAASPPACSASSYVLTVEAGATELPFTGFDTNVFVFIGLALLMSGGFVLRMAGQVRVVR